MASAFFSPFMLAAKMTQRVFRLQATARFVCQNIWLIYKNGARFFTYFWSNVPASWKWARECVVGTQSAVHREIRFCPPTPMAKVDLLSLVVSAPELCLC